MAMFKKLPILLAVAASPLLAFATESISLTDSALGSGCGEDTCCIAECLVGVSTDYCSTSYVAFSGTCQSNMEHPNGSLDIDNCDGWKINWANVDGVGTVVAVAGPDHAYEWHVEGCEELATPGGVSCTVSGDNQCKVTQLCGLSGAAC